MSYLLVSLKTLSILLLSKIIIFLAYLLHDYVWKYNTDKCSIFSLIVFIYIPMIFALSPILVVSIPRKISRQLLADYIIMCGFNLLSSLMFLVVFFVTTITDVDYFCNKKTITDQGIKNISSISSVFNYLGIFFWICEIIAFCAYYYKYYKFGNNEADKN